MSWLNNVNICISSCLSYMNAHNNASEPTLRYVHTVKTAQSDQSTFMIILENDSKQPKDDSYKIISLLKKVNKFFIWFSGD